MADLPLGVSDKYVCLTNGMTLFCLEAATGKPLWHQRMDRTAGGGPVITDKFVYVPKVNGTLEVFSLDDPNKPTDELLSFGRAMNSPVKTRLGNTAWVTDRQTMFVAPLGEIIEPISYRIGFNRPISGNVAAGQDDTLVVVTDDGAVHCFSEPRGALLWKQFLTNPLRVDPLIVGDDIFLVSLGPSLTVLSLETGREKWTADRISQVLSVSADRVYAKDETGRILVLDRKSGRRISVVDSVGLSFAVTNPVSDRFYVGTRSGIVQCVRQIDKERVELNLALDLKPNIPVDEGTNEGPKPTTPVTPKPSEPVSEDPFGVKKDADPFGID